MLILVVEDEALVALDVVWALQLAGHDVLGPVDNFDDAIAIAEEARPDLALVDLNLRDGGDGAVVARCLQQRFRVPALFVSAEAGRARAHKDVALGLVRKPYDIAALPRIIRLVAALAAGRKPTQIPPQIEMFVS